MQITSVTAYEYLAPKKTVFGWGRRREAGELAASLGRRTFLVTGSRTLWKNGTIDEITAELTKNGVTVVAVASITREPRVVDVDAASRVLADYDIGSGDFILAIGGGAAIDLAKAAAAMATNRQSDTIQDYLEGVGKGFTLENPPLPIMAMPTTGGTGTEATKNAVVSNLDPPFKKSIRHESLVPTLVLIDPELSVTVPPAITAATGMDAITQLIESYISRKARPIPQALALQGLALAVPSLAEAVEHGESRSARENMAHAALLSGMALANSGLGMAHGVAAALGVHAQVPHGLACAVMLPTALRVNCDVRRSELTALAPIVLGRNGSPEEMADAIQDLSNRIGIPQRLSELGVTAEQLPAIARDSRGSSMSGNPRELSDDELLATLKEQL